MKANTLDVKCIAFGGLQTSRRRPTLCTQLGTFLVLKYTLR